MVLGRRSRLLPDLRVDIGQIHNFVNSHNFTMMRNVVPSGAVLGRHPFLRGAIPSAVLEGPRVFPSPGSRTRLGWRINKPPRGPGSAAPVSPVISRTFPKFTPTRSTEAVRRKDLGGIKGMTLPRQAERPLTPFMSQQIRVHRQLQGPPRIETLPEFRPLARPEIIPQVDVIRGVSRQTVHPSASEGFQPAPGVATPEVLRGTGARRFRPPDSRGLEPAPAREFREPVGGGFRAVSPRAFHQPFGFRSHVPREFRLAPDPFFRSEPRATFGTRPFTRGPRGLAPARKFSPSFRR